MSDKNLIKEHGIYISVKILGINQLIHKFVYFIEIANVTGVEI